MSNHAGRSRFITILIAGGLFVFLLAPLASSSAARPTCFGKPATIVGRYRGGITEIRGTARADVIVGTDFGDRIVGRGGNDLICGLKNSDVIRGGGGNDKIKGGQGGFNFKQLLIGGPGDDRLIGGIREDDFVPGPGDDLVDGGHDGGEVSFAGFSGGVEVDLVAGTATGEGSDTILRITNVTGSTGPDTIIGNARDNILRDGPHGGTSGDDDILIGGGGFDSLYAWSGNDTLDGREGATTVSYINLADPGAFGAIDVDLQRGTATGIGFGTDTLLGVRRVEGTDFDDTLSGDDGENSLLGGGGDDQLFGLGGNDFLSGGDGTDSADGGDGIDRCESFDTEHRINCEPG